MLPVFSRWDCLWHLNFAAVRPVLAGGRRDALPEGWQDTQKRWPLGNWQLSSPCFSSLGFRGSLWKVPSWYHFDRIPSCWPFLLSCAFCGLQRSLELSSSKQESLGTKPPHLCLKLISPTPVECIGDLCASAEQVVLQKNLKAGAGLLVRVPTPCLPSL